MKRVNTKLILTVRRCFLRMYIIKPHILDVTPRKVRTPSSHWRVFSMLTLHARLQAEKKLTMGNFSYTLFTRLEPSL